MFHRSVCLEFASRQSAESLHSVWVQSSAEDFPVLVGLSTNLGKPVYLHEWWVLAPWVFVYRTICAFYEQVFLSFFLSFSISSSSSGRRREGVVGVGSTVAPVVSPDLQGQQHQRHGVCVLHEWRERTRSNPRPYSCPTLSFRHWCLRGHFYRKRHRFVCWWWWW